MAGPGVVVDIAVITTVVVVVCVGAYAVEIEVTNSKGSSSVLVIVARSGARFCKPALALRARLAALRFPASKGTSSGTPLASLAAAMIFLAAFAAGVIAARLLAFAALVGRWQDAVIVEYVG